MSYVRVLFVDITFVKTVSLVTLPSVGDRPRENLCSNCPEHNYTCKEPQLFSDKNCEVIGIHFLSDALEKVPGLVCQIFLTHALIVDYELN